MLDVDGKEGRERLQEILAVEGDLPPTLKVKTGAGHHYWFRTDAEIGNSRLARNIDIRCEGVYVVAPPSRHVRGTRYKVVGRIEGKSRLARAKAPGWLIDRLTSARPPAIEPAAAGTGEPALPKHPDSYGEAALAEEVSRLRGASPGQRNDTLNLCAFRLGQLVPHGILTVDAVTRDLGQAARQIGLGEAEIARTLKSGIEAGMKEPRVFEAGEPAPASQDAVVDELTAELARLGETDADNGQRFARRFGHKVASTSGSGFLLYDGKRWSREGAATIPLLTEETARLIAAEAAFLSGAEEQARRKAFSARSCSKGALDRMQGLAHARLVIRDAEFDADPFLLNVGNGTLDLKTGELRQHRQEDRLTKLAPVDYDPAATCPTFTRFLETALGGDAEFIAWFQKAVGYSLTGDMREQLFFLLQGPGRTGKSTVLNVLRDLLADYGQNTPADTFLAGRSDGRIPADIARLKGTRFLTAVEANWNRAIDEALIKSITGGDAVTARHLYRDFFEFRPQCKVWLAVNDFPKVRGTDGAFWRRVRVVPFTEVVEEKDVDDRLDVKLRAEAAGILAWAVQGCLRWQAEGLGSCAAVDKGGKRWKSAADHVKRFIQAELIFEQDAIVYSADLYARFRSWCADNGEATLPDNKLKSVFEGEGLTYSRGRAGSVWSGIKLRIG